MTAPSETVGPAQERLSCGEEIRFGEGALTRLGLCAGGTGLSWADIGEILRTDNVLVVLVEGRSKPVRVARRSGASYERALLIVAGEQVVAARGQPGRP
jgi:hypothetical protein